MKLEYDNSLSNFAFKLDWRQYMKGECAAVDTACSSSMAAVHLGRQSLASHCASVAAGVGHCSVTPC